MGLSEKGIDIVKNMKVIGRGLQNTSELRWGSDEALKEHIEVYITKLEQLKSKL